MLNCLELALWSSTQTNDSLVIGKVKCFSVSKGFGFITPDDGSADVFIHLSNVGEAKLPTLESGAVLEYSVGSRKGKSFAERLLIVPGPNALRRESGTEDFRNGIRE